MTRSKRQYLPTKILIVVGVLVWVCMASDVIAYYGATYAESAHGNTSYGVNRSGTGYPVGSCAHCHDTFDPTYCGDDPNGLMLFASNNNPTANPQFDNFCYKCHMSTGSAQDGGIINHTYSTNFGGGTPTFTTIYDAFNPTSGSSPSSHNLADVLNHAVTKRDVWLFTAQDNPCTVCHNLHTAQRNFYPPDIENGMGGVRTAVRKPSEHDVSDDNLWGDEPGNNSELMSEWVGTKVYQSPVYAPWAEGKGLYEPANDSTHDGSNVPSFTNTCRKGCHQRDDLYSTEHGRILQPVNWTTSTSEKGYPSIHGKKANKDPNGTGGSGYLRHPFTADDTTNFVLSCLDCHEPHGSENEWLLRTTVNGKDNIQITESGWWWDFCTACHVIEGCNCFHDNGTQKCSSCHFHNKEGSTDYF